MPTAIINVGTERENVAGQPIVVVIIARYSNIQNATKSNQKRSGWR